ncbi:MAG: Hsp70 family protein [Acidobacteria bacterium]|nr:Hsp70 family protein [Acidobacteriota bacterium]
MNIGIDLGTTNSALAYIDPVAAEGADFPPIQILEIPQWVASNTVEPRRTLPSFLFLGDQEYVGAYARDQGALVPTKVVHSAKSWLSNPDVDRTARILPWDAQESGRIYSPVEASTKYLAHIREAWEKMRGEPIAEQNVVLTVPASFDEEARELTVQAANEAGLTQLTLVEEPAAAFYSWIANHLAQSQKSLFDGQVVLVCDVGGGTSDFTLIRVSREGDRVEFTRTAVGKHLLLGGDNLDLTFAWLVEAKLGVPLSLRQRSALRRQCAAAKERLLGDAKLDKVEVTVLGAGTGLVGGTMKSEITRAEALELALDGFLPFCDVNDQPKEEKRSLFRELGLPYVSDPAITRHLAAFLGTTGQAPDAILFNGGFFIPAILRERVTEVVERWYGRRPAVFENQDLDLAVAVGAAYYSYVRSTGAGLLVRGGLPRAYYIGVGGEGALRTVCLVPRGTEEGTALTLDREDLQLVANKPVSFRLYSSLTRTEDQVGDLIDFAPEELDGNLHQHAPLNAVIRFGRKTEEKLIPVKLGARLNEVGTLEIWAESRVSEHRWRLQFELRKQAQAAPQRPAAVVSEAGMRAAHELLRATFEPDGALEPPELPSKLEQALALGRNSWPLANLRQLADWMIELAGGRSRSPAHEARWFNLCGFCLRPGFGYPGDDFRIEQARRIYASGMRFPNQVEAETQWWIFWGRLAGGLNRNQQIDLFQRLSPFLLPKAGKRVRLNTSLLREMWRTAASLELLPLQTKTDLGEALLKKVKSGEAGPSDFWCLSRLGARRLLYGPINQVVSPVTAARWVDALIKAPGAEEVLASIAQVTGEVTRDLPGATLNIVRARLKDKADLLAVLEGEEARDAATLGRIFGEELPAGLVFAEPMAAR